MQEGEIVDTAWGREHVLTNQPKYCAKILEVDGGMTCSLHRHKVKEETFIVLTGSGWIETTLDPAARTEPVRLGTGCFVHLEAGTWHRFWTEDHLVMLEVSTHHDDKDVERETESGSLEWADISCPLETAIGYLGELLCPETEA
jgi:mannose-6-phosphate isomerase-like protein (cupin superfamily)